MTTSRQPPFRTSPSTIARYFFHDCERFLYYSAAGPQQREREAIPAREFDGSPLVEAILQSGYEWEREVVERQLKGRVVVGPGEGELHTRRLSPAQRLRCLRREPPGRFLYQPTLSPPPRFYETYGIDPGLVLISDNHPDLVEITEDENGRLLRVIDVKRGETLKPTHRVQILLYALELQALLDAEGITTARVDLDQGAVWLGQQPQPELFNVAAFRPHLERFLRHDLGRILAGSAHDARWHLYLRCGWCEFFEHCRDEMRRSDDVSRLERLTTHGKRHLVEAAGVRTLTELGRFLKRADADEVLDRCASLAGQRHRLAVRVEALETDEPQLHGASPPDLPQGENIAVFLTLQQEPLGQLIYLAGVLVSARDEVRRDVFSPELVARLLNEENRPQPCVWLAATPSDAPVVRLQFIELLFDLLSQVHIYNEQQPAWKDKLSLQAYVHTEQERGLLFACLLEALQEPDLAEKAMTLLFHFQGPELMQADRHPGSEIAYPVVVLLNAVGRLLALPVEVSYTLPEMLAALGSSFTYTRKDYYHFPLGHGLRAESLHAAWYRGKNDNLAEILHQARLYLFAVQALLRAVRERAATHLFAWPPKFALPSGAGIRNRLLSRLAFFARYESLLNCLAVRESRTEARPTQVLLGQVIELRARSAFDMEVIGELVREPEAGGFPGWLLVRDNEEGRRAQLEYADYWYREKFYGGAASPHRAVVGVQSVVASKKKTILRSKYAQAFQNVEVEAGERFLLYPRFTDFITDKVVKFLERLDKGDSGLFLELLQEPEQAASPLPLPKKVDVGAGRLAASLEFTPSQADAYAAICRQRVTAVWGPPGTGKTHFLASAIVGLAAAHACAGRPFRCLVTAFTHAAIENLLRKLVERALELNDALLPLAIGKAKYWQGATAYAEVIDEEDVLHWLATNDYAVFGSTVYSCLKNQDEVEGFDLVVIDEASQVRVPEAAVAVSLIGQEGRLVLAGDHLQLPLIVAGRYPDVPPTEPLLHRSIFEAVCPRPWAPEKAGASRIVRQLLENFRMNDVLTSVAAQLLYGPRYTCCNEEVAGRRLAFKARRDLNPLVVACLDPDYPLVVVILDGIRGAQANPVEADLVAQLVTALRDGLRDAEGRPYGDDAAFFRQGVFIVSPHHAQIRAIQKELASRRKWDEMPFVDTVDKMQGQEADAVIVSYGVADPEFALQEAEFIYGLNRLNVAVTRARTKSVVCLPRPLLEATPQVLDVEAAATGLAFMRQLVMLAEAAGEEVVFEGEGVEAHVLRTGRALGDTQT
jgi:DNA replication ATP-dependent helicase Dna2